MPRPRSLRPYVCGPYKHRKRWRVIVYTPRADGGRDRAMESRDTRQAAEALKRQVQEIRATEGRTIAQAVTEYLGYLARKGNKAGSIKTAQYRLDSIMDLGKALIDLTPRRCQEFYDDLVDEGGAADTHQGALVAAKAFGRFVVKQGWMKASPFEKIEPVGRKSRGKEQLRIDEGRKFIDACFTAWRERGDRGAIAAALPLILNLRASEVAQLGKRDVDDDGHLLWVGEEDAKTDAGRRRFKIPVVLVAPMLELAASPATADGHLFAMTKGVTADRHWVRRQTRRLMKAAGVKVITTHGLRGTHATFGTVQGVTGDAVARSMGHTDPGMTKRHYIDAESAAGAQADRVADSLAPRDKPKDQP